MTEGISARAERRASNHYVPLDILLAGLSVWVVVAVICYFFHLSRAYGLVAAVIFAALYWRHLYEDRKILYLSYLVEELDSHLNGRMDELKRAMSEWKRDLTEIESVSLGAQRDSSSGRETGLHMIHEPPGPYVDPLRRSPAPDLEHAVEFAILETGATTLKQMGMVIKAARAKGTYKEEELRDRVRSSLEGR